MILKCGFYVSSKPEYRFEKEDLSEGYIDIGAYMRNKERPRYESTEKVRFFLGSSHYKAKQDAFKGGYN